jgi:hypothetical protein
MKTKRSKIWALERKKELNEIKLASSKGVEEIHHLIQETLLHSSPHSPPLSLCIMLKLLGTFFAHTHVTHTHNNIILLPLSCD